MHSKGFCLFSIWAYGDYIHIRLKIFPHPKTIYVAKIQGGKGRCFVEYALYVPIFLI